MHEYKDLFVVVLPNMVFKATHPLIHSNADLVTTAYLPTWREISRFIAAFLKSSIDDRVSRLKMS